MARLEFVTNNSKILVAGLFITALCARYCLYLCTDIPFVSYHGSQGMKLKHRRPSRMFLDDESPHLLDDVTIVTAYTNIGSFHKGSSQKTYSTSLYYRWMRVFRYMHNPLVIFFDNVIDAEYFTRLVAKQKTCHRHSISPDGQADKTLKYTRTIGNGISEGEDRSTNKTLDTSQYCEIIIFNRNLTWAFNLLPMIKEILSRSGYPKHMPTTVVPEYQSIQHLKYELVKEVAERNPFRTKYFAWTDIGLFRHLVAQSHKEVKPFKIYLPPGLDTRKVAYNEVTPMVNVSNKDIFYRNMYWVCGCFFIAERGTILQWADEYKNYTERFLRQGLANTDQRVIYAMQANERPTIKVQPYKHRYNYNAWFDLAYLCKEEGSKRLK